MLLQSHSGLLRQRTLPSCSITSTFQNPVQLGNDRDRINMPMSTSSGATITELKHPSSLHPKMNFGPCLQWGYILGDDQRTLKPSSTGIWNVCDQGTLFLFHHWDGREFGEYLRKSDTYFSYLRGTRRKEGHLGVPQSSLSPHLKNQNKTIYNQPISIVSWELWWLLLEGHGSRERWY